VSNNDKYDGFVNYSMCQATGYKLKSNKELPCAYQVFSKLIPKTKNEVSTDTGGVLKFTDTVNGNQLYPMFSILEFEHDRDENINAINVELCRVTGIFKADGKDSFTQTSFGTKSPSIQYLVEINDKNKSSLIELLYGGDDTKIQKSDYMYGEWVSEDVYLGLEQKSASNRYLYIKY
jgi:hypothetical protein